MIPGILDRYILKSFAIAYGIWVSTVLGFYLIVDAFNHLGSFSEAEHPVSAVLRYYAYHLPLIFQRLAPFILLLAAIFAVTWLNRQNELVPMLSSGRSSARVLAPIFAAAIAITLGCVAIQEVLMPSLRGIADDLTSRSRRRGKAEDAPGPINDGAGGTLRVLHYHVGEQSFDGGHYSRRVDGVTVEEIYAARGRWIEDEGGDGAGRWLLEAGFSVPVDGVGELEADAQGRLAVIPIPDEGLVLETDIRPEELAFALGDAVTASTAEIWAVASRRPGLRHLRLLAHARVAYPLSGIVLLLVGLPFAARPDTRDVYQAVLLCLVVSGSYFFCDFVFQDLALQGRISERLGGWFAPIAFAMIGLLGGVELGFRSRRAVATSV